MLRGAVVAKEANGLAADQRCCVFMVRILLSRDSVRVR